MDAIGDAMKGTSASPARPSPAGASAGADWRRVVEPYTGPDARRASLQLLTTLAPLMVVMWVMHVARDDSRRNWPRWR